MRYLAFEVVVEWAEKNYPLFYREGGICSKVKGVDREQETIEIERKNGIQRSLMNYRELEFDNFLTVGKDVINEI